MRCPADRLFWTGFPCRWKIKPLQSIYRTNTSRAALLTQLRCLLAAWIPLSGVLWSCSWFARIILNSFVFNYTCCVTHGSEIWAILKVRLRWLVCAPSFSNHNARHSGMRPRLVQKEGISEITTKWRSFLELFDTSLRSYWQMRLKKCYIVWWFFQFHTIGLSFSYQDRLSV